MANSRENNVPVYPFVQPIPVFPTFECLYANPIPLTLFSVPMINPLAQTFFSPQPLLGDFPSYMNPSYETPTVPIPTGENTPVNPKEILRNFLAALKRREIDSVKTIWTIYQNVLTPHIKTLPYKEQMEILKTVFWGTHVTNLAAKYVNTIDDVTLLEYYLENISSKKRLSKKAKQISILNTRITFLKQNSNPSTLSTLFNSAKNDEEKTINFVEPGHRMETLPLSNGQCIQTLDSIEQAYSAKIEEEKLNSDPTILMLKTLTDELEEFRELLNRENSKAIQLKWQKPTLRNYFCGKEITINGEKYKINDPSEILENFIAALKSRKIYIIEKIWAKSKDILINHINTLNIDEQSQILKMVFLGTHTNGFAKKYVDTIVNVTVLINYLNIISSKIIHKKDVQINILDTRIKILMSCQTPNDLTHSSTLNSQQSEMSHQHSIKSSTENVNEFDPESQTITMSDFLNMGHSNQEENISSSQTLLPPGVNSDGLNLAELFDLLEGQSTLPDLNQVNAVVAPTPFWETPNEIGNSSSNLINPEPLPHPVAESADPEIEHDFLKNADDPCFTQTREPETEAPVSNPTTLTADENQPNSSGSNVFSQTNQSPRETHGLFRRQAANCTLAENNPPTEHSRKRKQHSNEKG